MERLDRGSWDEAALQPAALNLRAAALGSRYGLGLNGVTAAPAFFSWPLSPFLRPFDASAQAAA